MGSVKKIVLLLSYDYVMAVIHATHEKVLDCM
jgi:hypothetical protein